MKKLLLLLFITVSCYSPFLLFSQDKQAYPNVSGVWVINELNIYLSVFQSGKEVFLTTMGGKNVWYAKGSFTDNKTIEALATTYYGNNCKLSSKSILKLNGDNFITNYNEDLSSTCGSAKNKGQNTWKLVYRHK
jgi:hypothetical protein